MLNFFQKNNKENNTNILEQKMNETKDRFYVFIDKLEAKLTEFAEASIPELTDLSNTDADEYKRGYHRMKAAVIGQIDSIRKRAYDVKEEKILPFQGSGDSYYKFREACYSRYDKLEALCNHYREKVEDTYTEDYEAAYKAILNEHEIIKNSFCCSQCGSNIAIDKIYFTTTYLTCTSCQTQNSFEPSSQAKTLEHLGRNLAEQRTKHLLKEYYAIPEKLQQLYLQKHSLEISLIREADKAIITQKEKQIQELEKERTLLEQKALHLYQTYLRAMFDEWNKINPALADEHEKFYIRLLNEHNSTN